VRRDAWLRDEGEIKRVHPGREPSAHRVLGLKPIRVPGTEMGVKIARNDDLSRRPPVAERLEESREGIFTAEAASVHVDKGQAPIPRS
jgi:hypothetical protein